MIVLFMTDCVCHFISFLSNDWKSRQTHIISFWSKVISSHHCLFKRETVVVKCDIWFLESPQLTNQFYFLSHNSLTGSRFAPKSNRLIYQLKMQTLLKVGHDWTLKSAEIGGRSKAKLNYAIRVTCNENYYGDQCTVSCRSRDDDHGHYVCNEKGERVCLPGWTGVDDYCKTREYSNTSSDGESVSQVIREWED